MLRRYGRIDVLVNNAGYALRGAVEEVDVGAVGRMFDTNVLGIVRTVQAVAPVMRRQGSGRIVNVGSLAGKLGGPTNGTYAATKHAVEALSDALLWELEPFGVQVVLVRPGAIATAFERTVARESGTALERTDSPYVALHARVAAANDAIRATQPGPHAAASVILAALRAEHPAARYPAAIPTHQPRLRPDHQRVRPANALGRAFPCSAAYCLRGTRCETVRKRLRGSIERVTEGNIIKLRVRY